MLGDTLRTLRKQHSMSQEEVANALNVSRQSVTKWENGASLPSSQNLIRLSELFHVSLNALALPESPEEKPSLDIEALNRFVQNAAERDRKKQRIFSIIKHGLRCSLFFAFIYGLLYGICIFLSDFLGHRIHLLPYIKQSPFFLMMSFFSIFSLCLKKKSFAWSYFLLVLSALVAGQWVGAWSIRTSPLGYSKSRFVLSLAWAAAFVLLLCEVLQLRDRYRNRPSVKPKLARRTAALASLFILLAIVFYSFHSYSQYLLMAGKEEGYWAGFSQGKDDAANGLAENAAFSHAQLPLGYQVGTARFSGFALCWSSGYRDGYHAGVGEDIP